MPSLPVLDLRELDSAATRAALLDDLRAAARDVGFFYLVGHGLPRSLTQRLFDLSRAFFALPEADKLEIQMVNSRHFRGYTRLGAELTAGRVDWREQIDIGLELPALEIGAGDAPWQRLPGPNQWPRALPALRTAFMEWHAAAGEVARRLLQAFALALDQAPEVFDALLLPTPQQVVKTIRYPGRDVTADEQGCGAHKDSELLTLLLQDEVGGLQVQDECGGWIDVPPLAGSLVVNTGELLELATNGYLRATTHRVLTPAAGRERFAIALFLAPALSATVPRLSLSPQLAATARGPARDPANPLYRDVGLNTLKGRLRSHPDVAARHYADVQLPTPHESLQEDRMSGIDDCFAVDYAQARGKFLQRAAAAGFEVKSFAHPSQRGPAGEALATDVARRGPRDARFTLLVSSGTHGVEGFCGSGCQNALLESALLHSLPANMAVVLVHAINPFGFAHLRRVNEDNVDCNRNFVRHGEQAANAAYHEVHPWLVPVDWEGPAKQAADAAIFRYIAERGQRALQAAVSAGQYDHADGLFYGGRSPVWSNDTWRRIVREEAGGSADVIAIDLHTGLGPRGVGEAIFSGSDADYRMARTLFGDEVTSISDGTSSSAMVGGTVVDGAREALAGRRLTMITLEYGTQPLPVVLEALRADNWLYVHGEVQSPLGTRIKAAIRAAFYVDESDWKDAVVQRFLSVVARAGNTAETVLG